MGFQMKLRKAFVVPLIVVAGLGVASAATVLSMPEINLKVTELLKPFNTPATQMQFEFTSLAVDEVRALNFGVRGLLYKIGAENEAKLDLKTASYAYGDGTKPTVDLDAELKFDLVKFMGQEQLNEFADAIDTIIGEAAQDFVADYGTAATVSATTVDKVVDAQGNIQLLKMKLSANVDLGQLPATVKLEDVFFQSVEMEVTASLTGVSIAGNVGFNPKFYTFDQDNTGLKEYIEALMADDQAIFDDLSRYLAMADGFASYLVDTKF